MSLMRLTWCVLAVPLLILGRRRVSKWGVVGALAFGALYLLGIETVFRLIAAPGGNSTVTLLSLLLESPRAGMEAIVARITPNIGATFIGTRYGVVQAWLYVAVLLGVLVVGLWERFGRRSRTAALPLATMREVVFHWYQLGPMLVACWVFYIADGYERVLLPHLLLSLVLLVLARRDWLVIAVIVAMAAATPRAMRDFVKDHSSDLHIDTLALQETTDALALLVPYQKDAPSPWCNTMLINLDLYDWHVIAIPPGIGVSWAFHLDELPSPGRATFSAPPSS